MTATYRVRSEGQELAFGSLEELRRAVGVGLVDQQDEVCAPGEERWTPVAALPELRPPRLRTLKRWWRPLLEAAAALLGPRIHSLVRNSAREWKGENWSPPRRGP